MSEQAKGTRTRAQIARLHELIMEQWDSYETRAVPVRIPALALSAANGRKLAGQIRLYGIRELMRMELPDRKTDLTFTAAVLTQPGTATPLRLAQWLAYIRRADRAVKAKFGASGDWTLDTTPNGWTRQHQGAECLYMIVAGIKVGESTALELFLESEVGDVDEDGMFELLDGWGRPIEFLRWAPGFATNTGPDGAWGVINVDDDGNGTTDDEFEIGWPGSNDSSELQVRDPVNAPDTFDVMGIEASSFNFALFPLIYSAGADGEYDIATDESSPTVTYATMSPPNYPYYVNGGFQVGRPDYQQGQSATELESVDNITNHLLELR